MQQPVDHRSLTMGLQVATFNVQNINANVLAVQDVLKNVDILAVQEHWLFNFEQQKLYDIDKNFTFAAKSVDDIDTISPFQKPRGYGGVAVFWRKISRSLYQIVTWWKW